MMIRQPHRQTEGTVDIKITVRRKTITSLRTYAAKTETSERAIIERALRAYFTSLGMK